MVRFIIAVAVVLGLGYIYNDSETYVKACTANGHSVNACLNMLAAGR